MNLIETLQVQADTIRNRPIEYKIGETVLTIKPLTVGQQIAISPHVAKLQIEDEINSPEDFFNIAMPKLADYVEPIKAILKQIIDYDVDQMEWIDVSSILLIILSQMDTKSFLTSIILVNRISRNTREEIIAAAHHFSTLSI